jgi:thioredoxin reductase
MDIFEIATYIVTGAFVGFVFLRYFKKFQQASQEVMQKVESAKQSGRYEPLSLYPYIDPHKCIGSGACVNACPEKDVLGIMNGHGTLINTTSCIGHGACFLACPVDAISLRIGTEKRGVELPHVKPDYETNVEGVFIAGELGGMGLIKNSIEQGISAVNAAKIRCDKFENSYNSNTDAVANKNALIETTSPEKTSLKNEIYDLLIVGAGPAGIGAALRAKELGLKYLVVEQDSLGGTVFTYPRGKIVMTHPVNLPLHGPVKLEYTSKEELLELWKEIRSKHDLNIQENTKVDSVRKEEGLFNIQLQGKPDVRSKTVLLAIGRRGTPRKLNIPGELSTRVAYRLIEAEEIQNERVIVVGGGDSAIEAALMLKDQNEVFLSYRKNAFARIKALNEEKIQSAIEKKEINILFNSELKRIDDSTVDIELESGAEKLENIDRIYIFAGGELPTEFLKNAGIELELAKNKIVKAH